MRKAIHWQISDTVINIHDVSQTFTIVGIEQKVAGKWVILKNIHTNEFVNGYELGLQKMGYVGYRISKTSSFS
jgi:hypothetical protein